MQKKHQWSYDCKNKAKQLLQDTKKLENIRQFERKSWTKNVTIWRRWETFPNRKNMFKNTQAITSHVGHSTVSSDALFGRCRFLFFILLCRVVFLCFLGVVLPISLRQTWDEIHQDDKTESHQITSIQIIAVMRWLSLPSFFRVGALLSFFSRCCFSFFPFRWCWSPSSFFWPLFLVLLGGWVAAWLPSSGGCLPSPPLGADFSSLLLGGVLRFGGQVLLAFSPKPKKETSNWFQMCINKTEKKRKKKTRN